MCASSIRRPSPAIIIFPARCSKPDSIHKLLDMAVPDWQNSEQAKQILGRKVEADDVLFMHKHKWP